MAVVHALSRSLGIFSAVPSSPHLLLIVVVATSAANFTSPYTPVVQSYVRCSVRPIIRSYETQITNSRPRTHARCHSDPAFMRSGSPIFFFFSLPFSC
ncbi:hypothetical protein EDC04DRAFT_2811590 [Pisolithus marmoratus]|nr:hypothetical protein EDC04DRAFT_2811590 [Pisolithus marmoratus]